MLRRLSATEIAEGALLADICVIFQLLVTYLPVGGDFFRVLIFVVFAVLVLRRGLYVGIMGMCVAVFVTAIVTGPLLIGPMLLECIGGLFLGITMKHRMHALPLLFLGITGGALALYVSIIGSFFLLGVPFTTLIHSLHRTYDVAMSLLQVTATSVALGGWWRHTVYPLVNGLATFAFAHWWALFYVALWLALCPFVAVIYATTNIFVRLLGYDVRPFPDGKGTRKLLRRYLRRLVRARRRRKQRRQGKPQSASGPRRNAGQRGKSREYDEQKSRQEASI